MKLHELVAATHSPFRADGSVAPEVVPIQAEFLAANGIKTIFMTGSTGESHSVSCAEKLALYDAWAVAGKASGLSVIAHVGSNCIEDSKILARRAGELGFMAISALSPSYYKPSDLSALIDCCAVIAAEAPETPFYYYDIPALTGLTLPMEKFLVEAPARIPTLAGIKFTNPDFLQFQLCHRFAGGKFDIPYGNDEYFLGAYAMGARGGVGSTFNFAPGIYQRMIKAAAAGDLQAAADEQYRSVQLVKIVAKRGYMGCAKALMCHLGVPVGPARLPLGNPSPEAVREMLTELEAIGFFEWKD